MCSNRLTSAEIEAICIKHTGINNIVVKKYEIERASKQPKFTSSKLEYEILKVTVKNHHFNDNPIFRDHPIFRDDIEYRFLIKILEDKVSAGNEFESELVVYESLIPLIRNNHPIEWISSCYLTKRNDTVDLMVLDDYSKRGKLYQTPDATLDHTHLCTAIRCIADMHVTSMFLAKRKPELMISMMDLKFEKNVAKQAKLMEIGIDLLVKLANEIPKFSGVAESLRKKICKKIGSTIEYFQPSKEFSNVFSHGNLRPDNIIFRYACSFLDDSRYSQAERNEFMQISMYVKEPTPIVAVFINFGMAYWTPPAMDVLYFLCLASTKENRNEMLKHYRHYVNHYLNVYGREDQLIFDLNEWNRSCEHYQLGALIKASIVVHNALDERLDVLNVEELERVCFNALKTNPNYSERISCLLDEIIEII